MTHSDERRALDARRWRMTMTLTAAMMVICFGFILLVAFNKPLLAIIVLPGLSLGILLDSVLLP